MTGTPYFIAPEVLLGVTAQDGDTTLSGKAALASYGRKADVWSLGILVCELLDQGRPPWPRFTHAGQALLHISSENSLPIVAPHISSMAKAFIMYCCCRDPKARPSIEEVLKHPWLSTPALAAIARAESNILTNEFSTVDIEAPDDSPSLPPLPVPRRSLDKIGLSGIHRRDASRTIPKEVVREDEVELQVIEKKQPMNDVPGHEQSPTIVIEAEPEPEHATILGPGEEGDDVREMEHIVVDIDVGPAEEPTGANAVSAPVVVDSTSWSSESGLPPDVPLELETNRQPDFDQV